MCLARAVWKNSLRTRRTGRRNQEWESRETLGRHDATVLLRFRFEFYYFLWSCSWYLDDVASRDARRARVATRHARVTSRV